MRIGLLSDTHGYLDKDVFKYFNKCDEIWHAGDFGTGVAEALESFKPLRGVYGNIDGRPVRDNFPKDLFFNCGGLQVFITHIGGYPGRYTKRVKEILRRESADLFICGHSHILKVMYDEDLKVLHMNPGACGRQGFHHVRTLIRFTIAEKKIRDAEVIELGPRAEQAHTV
ncbi:MAG: metallophosphatase family protein [Saprospiraceae bacterium]|nr:metallophosphatase family protein [Saprospiraceae bacterium]